MTIETFFIDQDDGTQRVRCCGAVAENGPLMHRDDCPLVAAAPDLLAALKAIVEHEQIDGTGIRYVFDWHSPFGQQARAAIAKAERVVPMSAGRDRGALRALVDRAMVLLEDVYASHRDPHAAETDWDWYFDRNGKGIRPDRDDKCEFCEKVDQIRVEAAALGGVGAAGKESKDPHREPAAGE